MRAEAHLLIGAAAVLPVVAVGGGQPWLLAVGAAAALLPDLDHPHRSAAIRYLGPLGRPAQRTARAASWNLRQLTGSGRDHDAWHRCSHHGIDPDHRALTHTALAAAVSAAPFYLFAGAPVGWAFFAGWLSHLLADACTRMGVPLLWPLPVRGRRWHMVRLGRLRSGAASDWVVAAVAVVGCWWVWPLA